MKPRAKKNTSEYRKYRIKGLVEIRPYVPGEKFDRIYNPLYVRDDLKKMGHPKEGDMVARNWVGTHWLLTKREFMRDFEEVE